MRILTCLVMMFCLSSSAQAQRNLHWASIDVDASLAADGKLRVSEMQTMVFTGDWNGGERQFNIRPRQHLAFIELARSDGGAWQRLTEDGEIDDRDEYAWTDRQTLRWRSREPGDPPFANTHIRYLLRYELSNILVKDGDDYVLDHDFLFADRQGRVDAFALRLRLDPAWQAKAEVQEVYTAELVGPGRGYVLTIPLRYTGSGVPSTWDGSRPPALLAMVLSLIGAAGILMSWVFLGEQAHGRFARPNVAVDETWLRAHILKYPAEVVGAAWDEDIGSAEVVALIARMVGEGKLESEVKSGGSMTLHLKVDRQTLTGHERTLVERLFFDGRTTTSTDAVKQHYRTQGFNPATEIKRELETEVERVMPAGRAPRRLKFLGTLSFIVGCILLLFDHLGGNISAPRAIIIAVVAALTTAIGWAFGTTFQHNIQFGRTGAIVSLIPALASVSGVAWFLWSYVGPALVEVSMVLTSALSALALSVVITTTNAMRSRRQPVATAFRKTLAAGREFFSNELSKDQPALRDEWLPWMLAFGLGSRVDDWSTRQSHPRGERNSRTRSTSYSTSSSSSTPSSTSQWAGFSGGQSGGAGGGAAWTTAASGLAAGVSPPSSGGSGGGGGRSSSSRSSSSGSSSGGSSGGGGGGGW